MKKAGILVIHGMGEAQQDYASGLINSITERLKVYGAEDQVEFESCYWSPVLQDQQYVTWRRMLKDDMDFQPLRRFIVSAFGDPVSYLSGYFREGKPVYEEIHQCVRQSLERLALRIGSNKDIPLMTLAHSLGSVIISNYIWDEGKAETRIGKTPFERLETLTSLITYGSNIPLFLPPDPPIKCIRFPSPMIPEHLRNKAKWINIYDPDDVLGYPLNNIWDDNLGTEIKDMLINAGGIGLSGTPLSHMYYHDDKDFLNIVEEQLMHILNV